MAPRWVPNSASPAGDREPIGRRLFAVPKLSGARDQKKWKDILEITHFLEKRDPGEVSLDRLGEKSVDGRVRAFLLPRARADGATRTPPKDFGGWAWIRVDKLQNPPRGATGFQLVASPVAPSAPGATDDNPYHAHVYRRVSAYQTATELRQLFHDNGDIEWVDKKNFAWKYYRWVTEGFARLKSAIKAVLR